ncbi:hypothetical protein O6H91_Y469700 [Diphasiastrum complanatum]|nr:hypothetical protein O6H91_Y469700 [Diphasiastrum complanatum]
MLLEFHSVKVKYRNCLLIALFLMATMIFGVDCIRLSQKNFNSQACESNNCIELPITFQKIIQKLSGPGSGPSSPGNDFINSSRNKKTAFEAASQTVTENSHNPSKASSSLSSEKHGGQSSGLSTPGNAVIYTSNKAAVTSSGKSGQPSAPSTPGNYALIYSNSKAVVTSSRKSGQPSAPSTPGNAVIYSTNKALLTLSRKSGSPSAPSTPGNAVIYSSH